MHEKRNLEQIAITDLYLKKNPHKCSLILSTGFGKSKVVIDILKALRPKKVLILVNSTDLRDDSWKVEFKKFKALTMYNKNVEITTYQTAYKWSKAIKNLDDYFIIADEVDFAADTEKYSAFFDTYFDVKTLGITGFVTDIKKDWFNKYLPVLKQLTANDAQKEGILNKLHFVFVKYNLSMNPKDIKVEYIKYGSKKHFTQSENASYDYKNKQVMILIGEQAKINTDYMQGKLTVTQFDAQIRSLQYKIDGAVRDRSNLLLTSISAATVTKKLIQYILKDKENKVIIFSKRTSQSEIICGKANSYNGKLTKPIAATMFADFQSSKLNYLGVCDKLNRGVNINNLNTAILETFYGSDTQAVQRFGRLMRLDPDKMATIYVLLPYYMRAERDGHTHTVQETQQVKWAKNMLRSTSITSYETWDYRTIKSNEDD